MDNEMKRRVFLTSILGTLIGVPVGIRLLGGSRGTGEEYQFTKQLKRFRSLANIPVQPLPLSGPVSLPLNPPIGADWKYVIYAPSFLPVELSTAVNGDPDMFFAREGVLYIDKTRHDQVVLTGGDTFAAAIAPTGNEDKATKTVSLFVKDGRLLPAKPQGQPTPLQPDRQLVHLLAPCLPPGGKSLTVGSKWTGDHGRIKPYTGLKTEYSVDGYAEIMERRCVDIAFSGNIHNLLQLPGVRDGKPEKDARSAIQFNGHDWFDLESGCLVRQEVRVESLNSGITGYKAKDGSDSIEMKTDIVIQIYPA